VKAFSLAGAGHLPVTGELHPLRREFTKWVTWANAFTLVMGIAIFSTWYFWSHAQKEEAVPRDVQIVKFTELGVPPSIRQTSTPQALSVAEAISQPSIGVPEPVPDAEATTSTIATQTEMSEALAPFTASDLTGGGNDSLVVELEKSPAPGEFVPFDELPVLLSVEPPVYPEMVRDAGIDGTVVVQVLVGKDGKVKQAQAVEGPEPLRPAGVASARTALFKPALQGTSPVEVWVMIPVTFQLQR